MKWITIAMLLIILVSFLSGIYVIYNHTLSIESHDVLANSKTADSVLQSSNNLKIPVISNVSKLNPNDFNQFIFSPMTNVSIYVAEPSLINTTANYYILFIFNSTTAVLFTPLSTLPTEIKIGNQTFTLSNYTTPFNGVILLKGNPIQIAESLVTIYLPPSGELKVPLLDSPILFEIITIQILPNGTWFEVPAIVQHYGMKLNESSIYFPILLKSIPIPKSVPIPILLKILLKSVPVPSAAQSFTFRLYGGSPTAIFVST